MAYLNAFQRKFIRDIQESVTKESEGYDYAAAASLVIHRLSHKEMADLIDILDAILPPQRPITATTKDEIIARIQDRANRWKREFVVYHNPNNKLWQHCSTDHWLDVLGDPNWTHVHIHPQ